MTFMNAEARMTHTCIHYGGRFHPDQCVKRKAIVKRKNKGMNPMLPGPAQWHCTGFEKCLGCDGPVEIKEK